MTTRFINYRNEAFKYFNTNNLNEFKANKENIERLVYAYLDALNQRDEKAINGIFSALVLSYNFKVNDFLVKGGGLASINSDDCTDWIEDGIMLAFEYKGWEKQEDLSPFTCINTSIETMRKRAYQDFNRHPKKYFKDLSLYKVVGAEVHNKSTFCDLLVDESVEKKIEIVESTLGMKDLIQKLIDDNKIVQAIFTDCIAFQTDVGALTFSDRRVDLNKLSPEFYDAFYNKYEIKKELFDAVRKRLEGGLSRQRIEQMFNKTKKLLLSPKYFSIWCSSYKEEEYAN